MRIRSLVAATLFGLSVVAIGCSSDSAITSPTGAAPALGALPRSLSASERGLLSASNAFSLALWRRVSSTQHDSNVFISPLSASFALGMTMNGAANQTFDEMRAGLQLGTQSIATIDSGYKSLIALLTSLDPSVAMGVANSIWYRNTFPFNQSFLNDVTGSFNADVTPLNFDDSDGSLRAINGWVSRQTSGKIPTILQTIDPASVMYLINAIYFKGSWRTRFDPAQTQDGTFHGVTGDQPMRLMHRLDEMAYTATAAYQAVDLPYGDSAFTMTVVLPASGTNIDALSDSLNNQFWQTLTTSFRTASVDLYLPKVTMSRARSLIPDLQSLGMRAPFTDAADFSRMSSAARLEISTVFQKTFVDITEEGTEAAAVTAVGIVATSEPAFVPMVVDRPFLFVIRERLTGAILFMGKVANIP